MESESKNEMFILGAAGLGILAWVLYRYGGKSEEGKSAPASKPVQEPLPVKNNQNKTEDEIQNFANATKAPEDVAPPKQTGNGAVTNQEKANESGVPPKTPTEAPPSTSTAARSSALRSFVVGASIVGGLGGGVVAAETIKKRGYLQGLKGSNFRDESEDNFVDLDAEGNVIPHKEISAEEFATGGKSSVVMDQKDM